MQEIVIRVAPLVLVCPGLERYGIECWYCSSLTWYDYAGIVLRGSKGQLEIPAIQSIILEALDM